MSLNDLQVSAREGWAILRQGGGDLSVDGVATVKTGVACAAGHVRLSIGSNGEPRLLIPLLKSDRLGLLPQTPCMPHAVSWLCVHSKPLQHLDLVCLDTSLECVFAEVADVIISRINEGSNGFDAAKSTIEEFRALLVPKLTKDVSVEVVAGLLGELLVLYRLLLISPAAWRSWRGPVGDRHDFGYKNVAVEVKTSLRVDRTKLHIHGLNQLNAPANSRLYLLNIVVAPVSGGPLSIGALGYEILKMADDPTAVMALMSRVGCDDISCPEWNKHAFRQEGEVAYSIRGNFPRIVPSSFPNATPPVGVHSIDYEIDLSLAADYAIQDNELISLYEELAKCT